MCVYVCVHACVRVCCVCVPCVCHVCCVPCVCAVHVCHVCVMCAVCIYVQYMCMYAFSLLSSYDMKVRSRGRNPLFLTSYLSSVVLQMKWPKREGSVQEIPPLLTLPWQRECSRWRSIPGAALPSASKSWR